jgi:hypothetical protein
MKSNRFSSFFAGHVSRSTLLTRLLPLSFASFFGSLLIGILLFPGTFHWKKQVVSCIISPLNNPKAYWLPSVGIVAAAALILPFAGYVQRRLHTITPRVARSAGVAFALGLLLLASVAVPLADRLHGILAGAAAGMLALGMLCCCLCALRDRLHFLGGRRSLRDGLSLCWASLPLLPAVCGAVGGVMLLGRQAGQGWALHAADALRPTVFWQLAFWEWAGLLMLFVFFFLSVLWLPEHATPADPAFAPANSGFEGTGSETVRGMIGRGMGKSRKPEGPNPKLGRFSL